MLADIIRNANTEHEIYFLLTSYIESQRFGDKPNCMSEQVTRLPLNEMADLRKRFEQLIIDLDRASKGLDDNSCTVIRECVHIFGCALNRLGVLDEQRYRPQGIAEAGLDAHPA